MPLPAPENGLVISYSYLWRNEYNTGKVEGLKNRPCVMVLVVENTNGEQIVTVAAITLFIDYLETHKDEIDALSIFFNEPHRRREITYAMINELLTRLKTDKPRLSPLRVWKAYSLLDNYSGIDPSSQLTVLVALIRCVCQIDETLVNHEDTVRRNFQNWIMTHHAGNTEKFSPEQMAWLHMIRDHIASSIHIERDDLEMSPFDGKGGLAKMYQLFGSNMDNMFDELNQALAA